MHLSLLLPFALVAFCAATFTDKRNVFVNEDGTNIVVINKDGKGVHIFMNKLGTQHGRQFIEVQVTAPNMVTKTVQFEDDKVTKIGTTQKELLLTIFNQYRGLIDDQTFEKLLDTVEKHVRNNEINQTILYALQVLDTKNRKITLENPFAQMIQHEDNKLIEKRSWRLPELYQEDEDIFKPDRFPLDKYNMRYTTLGDNLYDDSIFNYNRLGKSLDKKDFDRTMMEKDFDRVMLGKDFDRTTMHKNFDRVVIDKDLDKMMMDKDFDTTMMHKDLNRVVMDKDFDKMIMGKDFDRTMMNKDFDRIVLNKDFDRMMGKDFDRAMMHKDFDRVMMDKDIDKMMMDKDFDRMMTRHQLKRYQNTDFDRMMMDRELDSDIDDVRTLEKLDELRDIELLNKLENNKKQDRYLTTHMRRQQYPLFSNQFDYGKIYSTEPKQGYLKRYNTHRLDDVTFNNIKDDYDMTQNTILRKVLFGVPDKYEDRDVYNRYLNDDILMGRTIDQQLLRDRLTPMTTSMTFDDVFMRKPQQWNTRRFDNQRMFNDYTIRSPMTKPTTLYEEQIRLNGIPVVQRVQYITPRHEQLLLN